MSGRRNWWIHTGRGHSGCGDLGWIRNWQAKVPALLLWLSARFGLRLPRKCRPASSRRRGSTAGSQDRQGRGALRATGGPQAHGRAMSGTSSWPVARSTAFTATRQPAAGSSRAAMTETYVELHARSAFSFLQGASLPEELVETAANFGYPAMALVDRDGVYGAPRFHQAAKKAGIRAHIGAEVTCTDGFQYPLLVENRTGYQNLCRLATRMKLRAKKGEGAATPEELAEFAKGLICLAPAAETLDRAMQTFGRANVFAEVQRHFNREEEARNQAQMAAARQMRIPLVATNGVRHETPSQREAFDVLTCIRNHVTLPAAGRLLALNNERHLKPAAEMARLFADLPEAIANTHEISARLHFTLADLGYEFPQYPVPAGETMMS